ncbi:MAG TPA: hypothetical protein VN982_04770 [Candidatus Dormibacteraeota bacterium]|nr:hypothetical protein [Candidatus Dormibacteraeota bacterium]
MGDSNTVKETNEMLADFLREVAALVLVFVPLEIAIRDHTLKQMVYWTLSACGVSGLALIYGVVLERRREDDASKRVSASWWLPVHRFLGRFAKRKKKPKFTQT